MGAGRRVRAAAVACVCVVVLGACGASPEPTASPSDPPIPSPTPTASPSPSISGGSERPRFSHRDADMTDGEALARLANPLTGEEWFDEPRAIATPAWAKGDDYLGDPSVHWFELGIRGDRTIVGYEDLYIQELFERGPGGTWTWIGSPSARDEAVGGDGATFGFPDVPLDEAVYYDSLTLPRHFTLPNGGSLEVPDHDRGGLANPGYTVVNQPVGTVVDSLGGYSILLFSTPVSFVWSQYYGVDAPAGVTYRDEYYMLATPYGTYIPLYYYPFGELADVTWSVATTFASADFTYLADLNDISCGIWDRDHNTVVAGIPSSQWAVGGTSDRDEDVYVPRGNNPLVEPLYEAYSTSQENAGQTPEDLAGFLAGPPFVAYREPDSGQWLVYLNGTYSGRAWC